MNKETLLTMAAKNLKKAERAYVFSRSKAKVSQEELDYTAANLEYAKIVHKMIEEGC